MQGVHSMNIWEVCVCVQQASNRVMFITPPRSSGTYMNIAMSIVWKLGSVLHTVLTTAHRERGYIEDCSWKEVNFCIVLQVLHNLKSVMTSKTMDGPKTWLGGTKTNKTKTWKNKISVETNRMCSLSLLCMWSLI